MKKCRQFFVLFLVLTLFMCFGIGAWADGEYSYTVRVFGGNQGSVVNHANQANIPYDGSFTFNVQSDVTVTNSKYVVRGLRESGKDNSEIITPSSSTNEINVRVVRDQDYVVAYGIPGNEVALIIRCTTADGTDLGVQEVFYGEPNSTILIKTPYVEGYRPSANFATAKLGASNRTESVVYYPITATTTTVIQTGGAAGGNANANAGTNAGSANPPGNQPVAAQEFLETQEIVDLDVPLAGGSGGNSAIFPSILGRMEKSSRLIPKWKIIFGVLVLFCVVSVVYWYLLFFRKKKRRDEEYENEFKYNNHAYL